MGLFSFFKTNKTGTDTTIDSNELFENESSITSEEIHTTLSIHPEWDVPKEQQYVFQFLSNELQPLKVNQISLSGIDIDRNENTSEWLVKAFFRSSLEQPVTMGRAELLILSNDDKVIAAKEFDLSELGEIPAKTARPWVFIFETNTQRVEEIPAEGWKIAFNVQSLIPHQLELESTWEQALSEDQKLALTKIVQSLPKLKEREVNFSGFQAKPQEDGSLAISLFIRNGHSQHINLEQLPLEVLDANKELVARGSFKLDSLQVKANTSKPWTFIFPKEMIQLENPDFSNWTVKVSQ